MSHTQVEAVTATVLMIGGPSSGKSSYLIRMWMGIERSTFLRLTGTPPNIEYVEHGAEYFMKGAFAQRNTKDQQTVLPDFEATLELLQGRCAGETRELFLPDIYGELWAEAVQTRELSREWYDRMARAAGAILFIRIHEDAFHEPLDWITAREILAHERTAPPSEHYPTQVVLCELIHFLEQTMVENAKGGSEKPRIAIVISAWDALPADSGTPMAILRKNLPMLAGLLEVIENVEVKVFGVSIFGGDPATDPAILAQCQKDVSGMGWAVLEEPDGTVLTDGDVTLPMHWVLSGK